MLHDQISKLQTLSGAVKSARAGNNGPTPKGRHGMVVDYKNWSVGGTRPKSDRGVTFHFKHTFVSKGKTPSKSYLDQTPAASHQAYIERPSAVERVAGDFWPTLLPEALPSIPTPERTLGPDSALTLGDFATAPMRHEPGLLSFGTTGPNRPDRVTFWRTIEEIEGRNARVQCRLIVELPYETDTAARLLMARDFCRVFEDADLPYWCTIHAPSGHNDARNYHMHIAYSDRPCLMTEDGRWDFATVVDIKRKNGAKAKVRPFKKPKEKEHQGRAWILELRRRYADVANFHLASSGLDKRYDARSYKESGIPKQPTQHLGTKAAIAEMYGVDTRPGLTNTQREVRFRLDRVNAAFAQRETRLAGLNGRLEKLMGQYADLPGAEAARRWIKEHTVLSKEGRQVMRKKEVHLIAREAVTLRLKTRFEFLDAEGERLLVRPPQGREVDAWTVSAILATERALVGNTMSEMSGFSKACTQVVNRQVRRLGAINRRQDTIEQELMDLERKMMGEIGRRSGHSDLDLDMAQRMMEFADLLAQDAPRDTAGARTVDPFDLAFITDDHLAIAVAVAPSPLTLRDVLDPTDGVERRGRKLDLGTEDTATAQKAIDVTNRLLDGAPPAEDGTATPKPTGTSGASAGGSVDTSPEGTPPRPVAPVVAEDPEMAAVRAMMGGKVAPRANEATFVGAEFVGMDSTPADLRRFEAKLDGMNNRDLRAVTFATRDAADLSRDPVRQRGYKAAYEIMRRAAARRGLDLDTGRHNPAAATDAKMASRHIDGQKVPEKGQRPQFQPHGPGRGYERVR